MIEPDRVLQPLDTRPTIDERLREYDSAEALAAAVRDAADALERSLRLLLRSDRGATDADRVHALSPAELPHERLIERLRQRELISIELAGLSHQTHAARTRAEAGTARADDADRALEAVTRLRREVHAFEDAPVREVAHHAVEEHALEEQAPVRPPGRRPPVLWVLAALVLAGVVALFFVLLRGPDERAAGLEAFAAGQYARAASAFADEVRRDPSDITARLYLARAYRRLDRHTEAAEQLRSAASIDPTDAAVRRELGHLFLDLARPDAAATQYRRALELEPDSRAAWIGLVRALRAAEDPELESTLRRAPAEVRAAYGSQPDTT